MLSRRVAGLNRAYRLEERWPDSLEYEVKRLNETIVEYGEWSRAHGYHMDADNLRET